MFSDLAKGFLWFAACALLFVLFTNGAFGQTVTRSHACYAIEDAKVLSHHLIEHEWVGYESLFDRLHAEGKCVPVLMPIPAPRAPIWSVQSNTFDVGLFPVVGESGVMYGLLLAKFARASGA